jgi:hypothetical protein
MKNSFRRSLVLFSLTWALFPCVLHLVSSYCLQTSWSSCTRSNNGVIHRLPSPYIAMFNRGCRFPCSSISTATIPEKKSTVLSMSSSSYYDEESDPPSTNNAKRKKPAKNNNKRSQLLQRLYSLFNRKSNNPLQSFWEQVAKIRYLFVTRFKALPRKMQIVLTIQLFTISLLLGGVSKRTYDYYVARSGTAAIGSSRASRVTSLKREKPVEVYYSTFLDLVEKSGKVRASIVMLF